MEVKRNNSLVLKLFFGLVLFVAIGTTSMNYAFANNHADTRFSRYSTGDGGDSVTPARSKTDDSYMYAYNDKSALGFHAQAAASLNGGNDIITNQVAAGYVSVPVGQSKYITNYVWETTDAKGKKKPRYYWARLLIMPGSHSKTWLSFLWSPDSI
ncbi:DUF2712 domain-containing protein [uncultured Vagococcus sp.]|uniref:DUF2712 domain-containing protein n=1 Tax=uncultured Vagococcus sp. TaxID=189676 RepID=UPI0028D35375|nr:DUF2712 domain-containing protein [uncultured Vagococcus sp.]